MKFQRMILRKGEQKFDRRTGERISVGEDIPVEGRIFPASPQDIESGFQKGAYSGFFKHTTDFLIGASIIDGNDVYEIKRVIYYKEKKLLLTELHMR